MIQATPRPDHTAPTPQADRAAAAAAEMRQTVVARTEAVAGAFARVSRSVRLTVLLAERLDRGWARGGDDRHAIARRQAARRDTHATGREAEGERTVRLTEALRDRLESLDTEAGIGNRSAEEIIGAICRDLGLDPVRMTWRSPLRGPVSLAEVGWADQIIGGGRGLGCLPAAAAPDGRVRPMFDGGCYVPVHGCLA